MNKISLLLLLLIAPLLSAQTPDKGVGGAAPALAAEARTGGAGKPSEAADDDAPRFMARYLDGAIAYIVQKGKPTGANVGGSIWFSNDSKLVHRIIYDRGSHQYFGYDLRVKSKDEGLRLEVEILPLKIAPSELATGTAIVDAGYRQLSVIKYPPKQTLKAGDTIALDLLTSADGREKVSDYITVNSMHGVTSGAPTATSSPRAVMRSTSPVCRAPTSPSRKTASSRR